jgi:hypothetical protein
MAERDSEMDRVGPIFVFGDHDREALDRMLESLPDEWSYIPISNPRRLVQYAKRWATTAIFIAAPLNFPKGGAENLLQQLLDDVGRPVIVMAETWSPEIQDRWKRMGASDCIPHPTRSQERMAIMRKKVQELATNQIGSGS